MTGMNHSAWKKALVYLLAVAMIFTTVDLGIIPVYAAEKDQKVAQEQQGGADVAASAKEEPSEAEAAAPPEQAPPEPTKAKAGGTTADKPQAEKSAGGGTLTEPAQADEQAGETPAEQPAAQAPAFRQTQTVDGVKVTVSAEEGTFPEGASLVVRSATKKEEKQAGKLVEKVRDTDRNVAASYTFDISIVDENGNELQPADGQTVNVSFKADEVADKNLTTEVFHINDDTGKAEALDVREKGKTAQVEVDGFSIYVVTFEEGTETVTNPAMVTYNFYETAADVTSGKVFHSQKVKAGDTLYMPSTPDVPKNAHFDGWYIDGDRSDADNKLFSGGENMTITTLPSNDLTVVAVSVQNHYATFYDEDGTTIVTRKLISDGKVTIGGENGVTAQSRNAHKRFIGWKNKGTADSEKYNSNELTNLTADIELEPVFETGIWINFKKNCNDATIKFIPSLFVPSGSSAQDALNAANRQIPDPDRNGYNFVYWSTNSNANELVGGGESAPYSDAFDWNSDRLGDDNINLYARYSEGTANYSIIVWKQNVDGTGYDYYDYSRKISASSVASAATGATVNLASNDVRLSLINNTSTEGDFTGFYLDGYDHDVQVKGDNSSVINIYYNRKKVTYYFLDNRSRNITGTYNATTFASEFSGDNYANYKMTYTGLYGASLPGAWPTYGISGGSPASSGNKAQWRNFTSNGSSGGNNVGTKQMIPNTAAYNFASDTSKEMLIYLYSNANVVNTNVPYYLLVEDAGGSTTVTVDNKSFGMGDGDGIETTCSKSAVTLVDKFYGYKLYKYCVDYKSNGTNTWKTATSGSSTGSPSSNLYVVYAKNESSIIFADSFDVTQTASPTQTHKYLDDISSVNSLEPTISHDGYEFKGWYLDKECTQRYNATTMPGNSVELFAGWKTVHHYVQVDLNGGSIVENSALSEATVINGKHTFHLAGLETVVEDTLVDGINPPEGYVLVGWENEKGKNWNFDDPVTKGDCDSVVSVPQEKQAVYGAEELDSMTIKPIWHLAGTIHIEYNPSPGTITHADDNIYQFDEDAEAIVYGIAQAPAGQRFVGWRDSKGKTYETGDMISLTRDIMVVGNDGNATVTLTAVYEGSLPVVNITYNANYSGANPATKTSDSYNTNDVVTLEGKDFFTREGYTLDGWATSANGDKTYGFGQKVGVDEINAETANTLYAHWVEHIHNWTYEVSNDGKTITATCDAAGHAAADGSPSVTIVAPTATVYSGSAISASLSGDSAFNTATGENVAIVYYRADESGDPTGEALSGVPKNAGKYVATVTLSDDTTRAKLPFEITKNETNAFTGGANAKPTITGWNYDGKDATDSTHPISGPTGNEFGTVTYVYEKKGEGGNWSTVNAADVKDAGDYRVKAVVAGTDNYNEIESAYTEFTISKADPAVTEPAGKTGLTYNKTEQSLVDAGSTSDGTIYYRLGESGKWTTEVPKATDAGDYDVYWYVAGDKNHNDNGTATAPNGPINVSIATATEEETAFDNALPTTPSPAPTYDGNAKALAIAPAADKVPEGYTPMYRFKYENGDYSEWSETVPTGTNAGTYTVDYYFKGDKNHENVTPTGNSFTTTIAKADISPAPEASIEGWAYGDPANTPSVSPNPENAAVTYEYFKKNSDNTYTSIGDTAPTDQGDYAVKATIAESANYNSATTGYKDFSIAGKVIAAKDIDVSFAQDELTYNGDEQKPTVTVKIPDPDNPGQQITLTEGTDFEITWPADVTNVGTKTPTITLKGNYSGSTTKSYEITKANAKVKQIPEASDGLTYNGSAQALLGNAGTATGGDLKYYVSDKALSAEEIAEIDDSEWVDASDVKATNEGTYYIYYYTAGDSNHSDSAVADPINVTISSKSVDADEITVTFPTGEDAPVYDGKAQKPVPKVTVPDPTDPTKTVELTEGEDFEVEYPEDTVNAGEKTAKIVLKGNYSGEKDSQKYEVKKRPLTVTIKNQTVTYGQSIKTEGDEAYEVGAPADGQTVEVTLAQSTTDATNDGEITATVTVKEGSTDVTSNYDITAEPASLTVNKATLDPTAVTDEQKPSNAGAEDGLTYTAQAQNLVTPPSADKIPEGYKLQYKLSTEDEWSDAVPKGTDAGTYEIVYKYVPIDDNHAEVADDSFKLEAKIKPADLSGDDVVIVVTGDPFTFNGDEQKPAVKVNLGGVELPASDYTVSYENNKKAGTATVTVTAKENGNCINANSTTFSIDAKPLSQSDVTVTFPTGEDSPVYNGEEQKPDPTVTVGGKTLVKGTDYDVIYPKDTVNAGEKTAKIVFKGDYINETDSETGDPKPITETYTVRKAPLTITANGQTVTTDNKFDESLDQVTVGDNELKNGDQLTDIKFNCEPAADTKPSLGEAQSGTVTLSGAKIMNGDKDVTANYEITYPAGTFKIKGSQEAPSDNDVKALIEEQTTNSITIKTQPGYEYILTTSSEAPAGEDWTTIEDKAGYYVENGSSEGTHTFNGLDTGKQYYVHARKVATDDLNPSPAVTVSTSTRPNIPTDAKECVDVDYAKEILSAEEGYEIYDPNGGEDGKGAWVKKIEDFTPGKTYAVRIEEKDGVAPSESAYYIAPTRADAPAVVRAADTDKTDTTITIKDTDEAQEYLVLPAKADGTPYTEEDIEALFKAGKGTDGTGEDITFTEDSNGNNIQPGKDYVIYNRTKAVTDPADPALASKIADPTAVTTKSSTEELSDEEKEDLKDTWSKDTAEPNSITVNGTDGYEYLVVPKGTTAEDIDWSKAEKCPDNFNDDGVKVYTRDSNGNDITENTDYEILVRKSETDDSMPSKPETIDAYTTRPAPEEGEGYTENYPDEKIEVENGYEIRIVEPAGTDPSDWTEGTRGDDGKKYVPLVPGAKYEIRKKADSPKEGDRESEPATFTTAERPEKPAPVAEDEISKKDTSITVNPTDEAQEYMVLPVKKNTDGTVIPYTDEELAEAWKNAQEGNGGAITFTEDANGNPIAENTDYVVINRIKATDGKPHSDSAASDPVTTKESQKAPTPEDLENLIKNQKDTSITINTEPGYEYVISTSETAPTADDWSALTEDGAVNGYYKEGSEAGTHTFDGLDPATKYYIHVRKAETDEPAPGMAASPAKTVETETKNRPPAPAPATDPTTDPTAEPKVKEESGTSIVVKAEPNTQYLLVPKGTDPATLTESDWENAKAGEDGEAIFTGLEPETEYVLVARKTDENGNGIAGTTSDPVNVTTDPSGQYESEVQLQEGLTKVTVKGVNDELTKYLCSDEERAQVKDGQDARVFLKMTDLGKKATKKEASLCKKQIKKKAGKGKVAKYYDLSLYKQVGNSEPVVIHSTKDRSVTVTVQIPKKLKNKDKTKKRTFYVFRVHDGKLKQLAKTTKMKVKIKTNKFSTYTIAYSDVKVAGGTLLMQMTSKGARSMNIQWTKVKGADGYEIYLARCNSNGKVRKCKKVKTFKGNETFKWTKGLLMKNTSYKGYVKAYVMNGSKKKYISSSKVMHAFTGNGDARVTNPEAVKLARTKFTLKKGQTAKLKGKVTGVIKGRPSIGDNHAPRLRYISANKKIVTVDQNGRIKAKAKGKTKVYVIAVNGVRKAATVTVK